MKRLASGAATRKAGFGTMRMKRSLTDRLVRRIFYKNYARNILYELQIRARNESADYVQSHMGDAVIFDSDPAILEFAVDQANPQGLFLEFGVAGGASIRRIAERRPEATVHGFDTFTGLPENWTGHLATKGTFSQRGVLPKVPANVTLHAGLFDQTLPGFLSGHGGPVSFVHVDCDLYASTRVVLDALEPRLGAGALVLFDEYFNYPGWRRHEYRAWQEFVERTGLTYEYVGLSAHDGHVLVRITDR